LINRLASFNAFSSLACSFIEVALVSKHGCIYAKSPAIPKGPGVQRQGMLGFPHSLYQ
jgi:hypothetical protein